MMHETFYTNGKNEFKDGVFSDMDWSAPYRVSPEEIETELQRLNLVGRLIKNVRFVSHVYNLRRDNLEEYAYNSLEELTEEERRNKSEYAKIDPDLLYPIFAEIDEPFLIQFEDYDRFEIVTEQMPEFRFSMNCVSCYYD